MDGMDVDTDRLRDKVASLSELLVTTMSVVGQLRQITVASSAFGTIGADVHAISRQVQDQAAANIVELAAVFQTLNRRSSDFAQTVARLAQREQERLHALRPRFQLPGGE
jgi:type III secretory pathway component EscS